MDLRHARTFVTVAELGTVSKAASRLRIAQPALSRQIMALEQELGLSLFARVGRNLVLTGEGEQLLGDCRALLSHAAGVAERAQLLRRGDTGVLKVAASPQFIEGAIAEFLRDYAKAFPKVRVTLVEAIGWPEIRDLLERGEVHLGQNLARAVERDDKRFASHPLGWVEQRAAFNRMREIDEGSTIDIKSLAPLPLLLLDRSYIFRRTFDATCQLAGVEPNIAFEGRTPHTLLAMAEAGHGVAVVPSAVRMQRYRLRVAGLTFQGRLLREPLAMFWDKRRPLPNYATRFHQMLAAWVAKALPVALPPDPKRSVKSGAARGRQRLSRDTGR